MICDKIAGVTAQVLIELKIILPPQLEHNVINDLRQQLEEIFFRDFNSSLAQEFKI